MHYVDWLELLNTAVQSRFRNVFRIMNLETTWSYEDDRDSEGKMAYIAIIYDMNENGASDYEPLIKFVIPLDRDKLSNVHLAVTFERLSKELKECLEKAFEDWSEAMADSRIVHWNNGMWDICDLFGDGLFSTEEEYVQNMLRIADILLARHEVVIFATTTPVKAENKYNKLESIQRYNDLIVPLLREKGVIINDLYAACAADIDRYVAADTLHLSEDGIALCAQMVADCIKEAAAKLPTEKQLDAKALDPTGAPEMFM
jgi:hypothetical protein